MTPMRRQIVSVLFLFCFFVPRGAIVVLSFFGRRRNNNRTLLIQPSPQGGQITTQLSLLMVSRANLLSRSWSTGGDNLSSAQQL